MEYQEKIDKFTKAMEGSGYKFAYSEHEGIATATIQKNDELETLIAEWQMDVDDDEDRDYFLHIIEKDVKKATDEYASLLKDYLGGVN